MHNNDKPAPRGLKNAYTMNENLKHYYEYRAILKRTIAVVMDNLMDTPGEARSLVIIEQSEELQDATISNLRAKVKPELEDLFRVSTPEQIENFIIMLLAEIQDYMPIEEAELISEKLSDNMDETEKEIEGGIMWHICDVYDCINAFFIIIDSLALTRQIDIFKLQDVVKIYPDPERDEDIMRDVLGEAAEYYINKLAKAQPQPEQPEPIKGKTPKERMQYIPELNSKEIDKIIREAVKAGILDENYRPITEIDIQRYHAKWGTQTFEGYGMALFAYAIAEKFEFKRRYNKVFCDFWGVPNLRQAKSDKTEAARQKARYVMNFIKNHIINS